MATICMLKSSGADKNTINLAENKLDEMQIMQQAGSASSSTQKDITTNASMFSQMQQNLGDLTKSGADQSSIDIAQSRVKQFLVSQKAEIAADSSSDPAAARTQAANDKIFGGYLQQYSTLKKSGADDTTLAKTQSQIDQFVNSEETGLGS